MAEMGKVGFLNLENLRGVLEQLINRAEFLQLGRADIGVELRKTADYFSPALQSSSRQFVRRETADRLRDRLQDIHSHCGVDWDYEAIDKACVEALAAYEAEVK